MSVVPLVSLMHVRQTAPGVELLGSASPGAADQERFDVERPSRSEAPADAAPATTAPPPPARSRQEGEASYFSEGTPGTCAHRTLPFGTEVKVTNLTNGRSTTCRVADRGPYVNGRILDLSTQGFTEIASISAGAVRVRIEW